MKGKHRHLLISVVFLISAMLFDGGRFVEAQLPEPRFVLSIPLSVPNGRCVAQEEQAGRTSPGLIRKSYQISRRVVPDSLDEPSRAIEATFDSIGNLQSIFDYYTGEIVEIFQAFQADGYNAGISMRSRDDTTQVIRAMPLATDPGAEYAGYLIVGEAEEFLRAGKQLRGGIGAGLDESKFQDRDITLQDVAKIQELGKWLWALCPDGK